MDITGRRADRRPATPRWGVTAGAALSAYPARAHAAGADLRTAQAGQAAVDAAGGSE